jgi:uncharacterized protein YndB with AHSA1/START domain/uncharacterized membrane protein YhaH (DUF805 family)
MRIVERWFGFASPVGRRFYLVSGVLLALVRYAVDLGVIRATTDHWLTPVEFLSPLMATRVNILEGAPEWVGWVLVAEALVFLWVAVSMSVRRAADAGRPPIVGLVVLIPFVNLVGIAALAAAPSAAPATEPAIANPPERLRGVSSAVVGVASAVAIALVGMVASVYLFRIYGAALFMATPILMGATSAWIYNRPAPRSVASTMGVATLSVAVAGMCILLFALEGAVCLAMAAPIAFAGAALGALVGKVMATAPHHGVVRAGLLPGVLALGALYGAERAISPPILHRVETSVVIDAPPERVWPHVVGFSEIEAERAWYFRAGIAAPLRARIDGAGVGAVRHCEFTTGSFVEPITDWDPPRRLAFDVAAQPAPMLELSPYEHVDAPHLDGAFRSQRGEFILEPLPGGRTRLRGRTYYTLDMFPQSYFKLWSDALLHRIHSRVLDHIQLLSTRQ